MLTPFEANLLPSLLSRFFASRALDVAKMKAFVPCDVSDRINNYKAKIVEAVYDPLCIPEVNARFREAGYEVPTNDETAVIAVNEDGSILLWGGLNSVFHLRKGEKIAGAFDGAHLAFNDILDLTARFKIKNKKVEIDELIAKLKQKYAMGK
ncbi:MAG: hypothetical protein QM770_14565 [Tepidisphaeraceae bacterium]